MSADLRPAKAELLAPGARVGRYYLLRRLAIGGMAELHLACAEGVAGFQKVVVLKHVLPHLVEDPDFVQLLLNEARLAATLDHPNIVQVTDIGEADGDYFFVMEYLHGRNAREILREAANRGGLPMEVALAIAIAAASGLHHAHAATDLSGAPLGLVHRDVSPANLLVSYDGAVKLTDFGIAKAVARSTETIGGAVKGKIGYMSPEQCRGEAIDQRSDLFALGVVLFELTTCERLFYADNDFAILNRVMNGRFDLPSDRIPDYPPQLEKIVVRALASDPDERYSSAEEVRSDLEAFVYDQRLRCTAATVEAWMTEAFGRPPYPRVELTDGPGASSPAVPTLVTPLEELPTVVTTRDPVEPPRRAGWIWPLAAVGAAAAIGAVMYSGALATDANPTDESPRGAAQSPSPGEVEQDDPPAASSGMADDVETSVEPAAPVAPDVVPAAADPATAPKAKRGRPRPKKRHKKKKKAAKADVDSLFPGRG